MSPGRISYINGMRWKSSKRKHKDSNVPMRSWRRSNESWMNAENKDLNNCLIMVSTLPVNTLTEGEKGEITSFEGGIFFFE